MKRFIGKPTVTPPRWAASHGGWIYAMRATDCLLVKIGCIRGQLDVRRAEVASQWHLPVTIVGAVPVFVPQGFILVDVERRVHAFLEPKRVHGMGREWFETDMCQVVLHRLVYKAIAALRGAGVPRVDRIRRTRRFSDV